MIGRTLSHYRIEEQLGVGGMGEVYRARDVKLDRDVALKVLPSGALATEETRRRFHKEAVALSRLSHPHIATLHDFDSAEGIDFLVMELVVGPTLEEELRKGPLTEKNVVRLGSHLARALAAAHEQGVVHRDLKPSNLGQTPDGMLKILDFGLAHLVQAREKGEGGSTATESALGLVVGSPPYMAPEQLLGKAVDARTDVYAAGACLYELATGKRPYGERRGAQLTEAILHESPPSPRSHNGAISAGLEAVILKCLDKDPALRYQTAKELQVDLERLQVASASGTASQPAAVVAARRRRWPRLAAAFGGITILACAYWLLRPLPPPRIVDMRPLTRGLDSGLGIGIRDTHIATDGARLYYLDHPLRGEARVFQVPVTGGQAAEVRLPFRRGISIIEYLPIESALLMHGREGGFSSPGGEPSLWIVPVPAGVPRLTPFRGHCAAVSPDGERLILIDGGRLVLVRLDGSQRQDLMTLESGPHFPSWAPDGRRLRFDAAGPDRTSRWIWETSVQGETPRSLWPGQRGRWTRDGRYFVFQRLDTKTSRTDLWAVREHGRQPWSQPTPVRLTSGPMSFFGVGVSLDGRSLFARGQTDRSELQRYDSIARRFVAYLDGAQVTHVAASPDGRWLAWAEWPSGGLWRGRPDGSERLKLTPTGMRAFMPRWSPDGTRIVFAAQAAAEDPLSLHLASAEGGEPQMLARPKTGLNHWDACWLPDGRSIVFSHLSSASPGLYRLDMLTRQVSAWPGTERMQYHKCAPQGHILAFERRGSGTPEAKILWAGTDAWEDFGPLPLMYPNWSRAGTSIIGLDYGTWTIRRFIPATRRLETVADVSNFSLAATAGFAWMGLAPDDSPLVLRDRSTSDVYALDWEAP